MGRGNSITNLIESFGEVDMTLEAEGAWRRVTRLAVEKGLAAKRPNRGGMRSCSVQVKGNGGKQRWARGVEQISGTVTGR